MLYTRQDDAIAATHHDFMFGPDADMGITQTPITVPGATTAATFSSANSTNTSFSTYSHARVGNHVIVVAIDGTVDPVTGVTEAQLTSQVGCMQANDCTTPIPAPQDLFNAF